MLEGAQIRAGRALLKWKALDLAGRAGVSLSTVQRAENTEGPATATNANLAAMRRAMEEAGVEFIPENGGGAGVRMRRVGEG